MLSPQPYLWQINVSDLKLEISLKVA